MGWHTHILDMVEHDPKEEICLLFISFLISCKGVIPPAFDAFGAGITTSMFYSLGLKIYAILGSINF